MKILQVIHGLRRAGAERVVVDLSLGLAQRGHEVSVCTLLPINQYRDLLEEKGSPQIKQFSLFKHSDIRFLPNLPHMVIRLKKLVSEIKPDIIHCHLPTDAAVCLFLKHHLNHMVRTIHINDPFNKLTKLYLSSKVINHLERRLIYKSSVKIVACSNSSFRVLCENGRMLKKINRVFCVPNGIDLAKYINLKRKSEPYGRHIIAIIGTLEKRKNHKVAFKAIRKMRDNDVNCTLKVVGDGPEKASLKELANELRIERHVEFLGNIPDVETILAQSSVYWMPSQLEGLPIATIEAMVAGVPIVASKIRGLTELLSKWPELLVPVNDHEVLARVTEKLLSDFNLRAKIGDEIRKEACKNYSAVRMIEDYLRVYHSV